MDDTIVVCVEQRKFHARYKKLIVRTKRLSVGTNGLTVSLGDRVCIERTKKMSRTKNWRLVRVLSADLPRGDLAEFIYAFYEWITN